jgi:hypothetical protein
LLNKHIPNIVEIVGVDVSPIMIKGAKERFAGNPVMKIIEHDLSNQYNYGLVSEPVH